MAAFFLAPENLPFMVALAIVAGLAVIELVGLLLIGTGLGNALDGLLPDSISNPEMPDSPGALLSWLRVGQVPLLFLLLLFLASFGLLGLGGQHLLALSGLGFAPGLLMSVPAAVLALPPVRLLGGVLGRLLPGDETSALSRASFIGHRATITLGEAQAGSPAQGKLRDRFGQTHYLMIEPDHSADRFSPGETVLLVRTTGAVFFAIRPDNQHLQG
jgi:hypothetical protein